MAKGNLLRTSLWGLLLLLTVGIYLPALGGDFIYDDLAEIVTNTDIHDLSDPLRILAYNPSRLLLLMGFALQWDLTPSDPTAFHWVNLLIHLANTLLLGLLIREALSHGHPSAAEEDNTRQRQAIGWAAWGASAIFALHPLFVETVAYIASRSSSQATLFILISILAFLRFRSRQVRGVSPWLAYALCIVSLLLALVTKEIATTLPLLLLLVDRLLAPHPPAQRFGQAWAPHLLPWVILAALAGLRLFVIGDIGEGPQVRSVADNLLTETQAVWGYLYRMVAPYPLSIYHDLPTLTEVTRWTALATLGHLILLGIAWRTRKAHRPLTFGILWFYISLLPSSSVVPLKEAFAEHRAYLPAIGLLVAFAYGLHWAFRRYSPRLALGLAPLLLIFSILTWSYTPVFADEIGLWRHATLGNPQSADAWYALGDAFRRRGAVDPAIEAYLKSIRYYEARDIHIRKPGKENVVYNYPDALNNLGLCYAMKGELDLAIEQFRVASRSYPELGGKAYTNLGYALILKGEHRGAERALLKAIDADPNSLLGHLHLANLYYDHLDQPAKSLEHYQAVLAIHPNLDAREAIEGRIVELSY